MKIHTMQMEITPTENSMRLIFDFSFFTTGTFTIGITLPFQVDSITETAIPPYPGNWDHINRASGSLVTVSYEVKELFEGRAGGITVGKNITFSENIVDKIYDISSLDLPFRGYTTSDLDKLIQEKGLRQVQGNISNTLTVALPHMPRQPVDLVPSSLKLLI